MPTRRIGPSMRVRFSPSIAAKETDSHRPRPTLASAVIKPVRKSTQRGLELRRQEIATLGTNLGATPITVDFDMESEVGPRHRQLQEAFDRIAACQRTWAVESGQQINRVKARSFAGTVVGRHFAAFGRGSAPLVATRAVPLACDVQGGRSIAYFYPGFVLVAAKNGGDFALIDLLDPLGLRAMFALVVVGRRLRPQHLAGSTDRNFPIRPDVVDKGASARRPYS
jgi:hypothetical protein